MHRTSRSPRACLSSAGLPGAVVTLEGNMRPGSRPPCGRHDQWHVTANRSWTPLRVWVEVSPSQAVGNEHGERLSRRVSPTDAKRVPGWVGRRPHNPRRYLNQQLVEAVGRQGRLPLHVQLVGHRRGGRGALAEGFRAASQEGCGSVPAAPRSATPQRRRSRYAMPRPRRRARRESPPRTRSRHSGRPRRTRSRYAPAS